MVCLLKRVPPLSSQHPGPKAGCLARASPTTFLFLTSQLSKNGRRIVGPVARFWLTTARGSPVEPGLSLEFEETQTRENRQARRRCGAYIFRPHVPVNTLLEDSSDFSIGPSRHAESAASPVRKIPFPPLRHGLLHSLIHILQAMSQSSHNQTSYRMVSIMP